MKTHILITALLTGVPFGHALADNTTVNQLLQNYAGNGAVTADVSHGKQLWQKTFSQNGERSCVSCHTKDLAKNGKHIKTRKLIKPMSPSVNPERLSDIKKVNKWFKRNCKWTLGRECTAQEKSDILVYIENSTKF